MENPLQLQAERGRERDKENKRKWGLENYSEDSSPDLPFLKCHGFNWKDTDLIFDNFACDDPSSHRMTNKQLQTLIAYFDATLKSSTE